MAYRDVPGGLLDVTCPIDWSHPLNRGLVGAWMVPPNPGWRGGVTLRDLVRGAKKPNDGTLTNMAFPATTTSGWSGAKGRPGGYGALAFDGSDDVVDCGNPPGMAGAAAASWSCWAYKASNAVTAGLGVTGGNTVGGNRFGVLWYTDGLGYFTAEASSAAYGSVTIAVGWRHLCVSYDGSQSGNANRLKVYVDGVAKTLSFTGTIPAAIIGTPSPWTLGKDSSNRWCGGQLDDARLWVGRALSAPEVASLYDQSRRGHPDTMRWLSSRAWSIPAAATGNRRRRVLITSGGR